MYLDDYQPPVTTVESALVTSFSSWLEIISKTTLSKIFFASLMCVAERSCNSNAPRNREIHLYENTQFSHRSKENLIIFEILSYKHKNVKNSNKYT